MVALSISKVNNLNVALPSGPATFPVRPTLLPAAVNQRTGALLLNLKDWNNRSSVRSHAHKVTLPYLQSADFAIVCDDLVN